MKFRYITVTAFFAIALGLAGLAGKPAHAQYFSNHDGYTQSGAYHVQVELDPYAWWPGFAGSVHFASPLVNNRTPGSFNSGLLSPSTLANTLHAAFIGAGLVRYGPYSTEMDLQYFSVSQSQTLFTGPAGGEVRLKTAVQLLRVAPGIGYRVYAGDLYGIPISADARVGFAYLSTWQTYTGEGVLAGRSANNDTGFAQPWVGGRVDLIPAPRWRIELGALLQGFGVDGGSWGWGASGGISYAINSWATINIAARAVQTERYGLGVTAFGQRRSMSLVAYGPIIGVGFRF